MLFINEKNNINIGGSWDTNYKELKLYQIGNKVMGRSELLGGVIEGKLEGNVLTGTWAQEESTGRCKYGRFYITFEETEDAFTGEWGYCDNINDGIWVGRRRSSLR